MNGQVLRLSLILVFVLVGTVQAVTEDNILRDRDMGWDGTLRRIHIPILMYHYVSDLPTEADKTRIDLTVSPTMFVSHIQYLKDQGYETVSLYQMDAALNWGVPLPDKPIVLTFDDGYIDHFQNVFPILTQFGFTGTFFIITARADAQDPRYLSWEQIQTMATAGMSMEAHTKDHADLRGRDYAFLVYQILGSMESLGAYTGQPPHMFSYPIGHYDEATLQVVGQLPIWRAVTTEPGDIQTTDNHLEVPRLRIHGYTTVAGLDSLLRGP